uniref:Uncharacterized protein n=1 Tax=Knipowitschia caucasica TaxID=637954 RepID=A0AAV2J0X6_KNICA
MTQPLTPACFSEDVEPVPEDVVPEEWDDPVSERLTAAWESEVGWHLWWSENLCADRERRTKAQRQKRRREKEQRRARGRSLLDMSGSFTSSITYQSTQPSSSALDLSREAFRCPVLTETSPVSLLKETIPDYSSVPERTTDLTKTSSDHSSVPERSRAFPKTSPVPVLKETGPFPVLTETDSVFTAQKKVSDGVLE